MSTKLEALRAEMNTRGIDGFFIPHTDAFLNEYTAPGDERLAWITGFTGSAGQAVVLKDKAAFFTDGRYTLQARHQVDAKDFEICSVSENQHPIPTLSPSQWIEENLPSGSTFGIDPWLHAPGETKKIREAVAKAGGQMAFTDGNPVDSIWKDRPVPLVTPAVPHPLEFSGVASADKRAALSRELKAKKVKALAVTQPEDICWLLNVRGEDIPHTPLVLSYVILHDDGQADWFVDKRKISPETRAWVGNGVAVREIGEFSDALAKLAKQGDCVWVDPGATPVKAQDVLLSNKGQTLEERSPITLTKARKNDIEAEGTIRAHIRDGAAETRFIAAILEPGAAEKLDELSAAAMLQKYRSEGKYFKGLSFETISGAGANGAVIHYHPTPETNRPLLSGPVYLVDSGGQYLDGTTDITRTIAIDPSKVTVEMKDRYTRVLKGHIRLAMSVFPEGTTGDVLDVKARAALREKDLDYAHGTGHGVGSYLSVHEGPCGISPRSTSVPLEPGFILSNEPGYYKEGEYGIRIENLVLVIDTGQKDKNGKRLLGFKTLTQAPIDLTLVEPSLLDDAEVEWLNAYHAGVREKLMPLLEGKDDRAAAFLGKATQPLRKPDN